MSGTTSVRRTARLALVPALAAGVLALPGAVAFADTASPSASPTSPATTETTGPAPAKPSPSVSPTALVSASPTSAAKVGAPLPKGGAQTGEGVADRGSATGLVLGAGLAVAGAAGIGLFAVRRRAGDRA